MIHGQGTGSAARMTTVTRITSMRSASIMMIATVALCACGSQTVATADHSRQSAVIGQGRTAAGATFVATVQAAKGCALDVSISESGRPGRVALCYARFESPSEPRVTCLLGSVVIHMRVLDATRYVRLTLSDGVSVTSPVMVVPRRLGGPATLYYQALRDAAPFPTRLTELNPRNQPLGVVKVPGVAGCTKQLVRPLSGGTRVLAKETGPGGAVLTIMSRASLRSAFGALRVTLTGSEGTEVIGSGALRLALPLEWEIKRVCRPYPYTIVYGLLPSRDVVLLGASRHDRALSRVAIPSSVRPKTVLVFGFGTQAPNTLLVRTDTGRTLVSESVSHIVAHTPCS
jgi:hypothetical protein